MFAGSQQGLGRASSGRRAPVAGWRCTGTAAAAQRAPQRETGQPLRAIAARLHRGGAVCWLAVPCACVPVWLAVPCACLACYFWAGSPFETPMGCPCNFERELFAQVLRLLFVPVLLRSCEAGNRSSLSDTERPQADARAAEGRVERSLVRPVSCC